MRLLTKVKTFALIFILALSQFSLVQGLIADPLFDNDDVFDVSLPSANSKVAGNVEVKWQSYDDDSTFVPYTISLLDAATCRNAITNLGSGNGKSSTTDLNAFTFDSKAAQTSFDLDDGKYCIKICAAYQKDQANYSACNSRIINIVNTNKLPVIESEPDLYTIEDGKYWEYEIDAVDLDNDTLSYRLVYGPSFLTMDNPAGVLSTVGTYTAVPANYLRATYRVVVGVDDGVSGLTTQEFQLTFVKGSGSTPVPDDDEGVPNTPSIITFFKPTENEIVSGTYTFEWDVFDAEGIDTVTVDIIDSDGRIVANIFEGDIDNYVNYDTTSLNDGEYFLEIKVKDDNGIEVSKISDKFEIENSTEVPNNEPLIVNTFPGDGSEITERKPTLYGEFATVPGTEINPQSLLVKIDDVEITDSCIANELSFECSLDTELSIGEHIMNVRISDTDENLGMDEIKFVVKEQAEEPVSFSEDIVLFGYTVTREVLLLLILLCCILFILLVIPWVLLRIWKKRNKDGSNRVDTTSLTVNSQTKSGGKTFEDYLKENALVLPTNEDSNYLTRETRNNQQINVDNFYVPTQEPIEPTVAPVESQVVAPEVKPIEVITQQVQPEVVPEVAPTQTELIQPEPQSDTTNSTPVIANEMKQSQPLEPQSQTMPLAASTEPQDLSSLYFEAAKEVTSPTFNSLVQQPQVPQESAQSTVVEPLPSEPTPMFEPKAPESLAEAKAEPIPQTIDQTQTPTAQEPLSQVQPNIPNPFTSPIPVTTESFQDKSTYVEPQPTDAPVDLSHMDSAQLDSSNSKPETAPDENKS